MTRKQTESDKSDANRVLHEEAKETERAYFNDMYEPNGDRKSNKGDK